MLQFYVHTTLGSTEHRVTVPKCAHKIPKFIQNSFLFTWILICGKILVKKNYNLCCEKNPPQKFNFFFLFFFNFSIFGRHLKKIGIFLVNRLIADFFFHDQTIFIKDCELYTIGVPALPNSKTFLRTCLSMFRRHEAVIRKSLKISPADFPI